MATNNFDGAEAGSLGALRATGGTVSVDTGTKRSGAYSYKLAPAGAGTGFISYQGWDATTGLPTGDWSSGTTRYLTVYLCPETLPSADEIVVSFDGNSSNGNARLYLTSGGTLKLINAAGTTLHTSSQVLSIGTQYRIELAVECSDTGAYTFRVYAGDSNSASMTDDHSGTDDFKAGASTRHANIKIGKSVNLNGSGYTVYADDVFISDSEFKPGKVEIMVPSADGTYTAWRDGASGISPYDYTVRDEIPATNSDFVQSTLSIGDADTSALESAASAGISGTVNAVLCLLYASTIGNSATFDMRYRSGSDVDLAGIAEGSFSPPRYRGMISTTKPAGGAWDTTALDALEIGAVEAETADRTRLHAVHAMVHFTEAAAAGNPWYYYAQQKAVCG